MLIRIKALEDERLSIMSELSSKRDDFSSTSRELQQYKDNIAVLEEKLRAKESESMQSKEITLQLEIEKELRSRCEVREEAERRERIAACAQLIAIQNETNMRVREIEERVNQQLQDTNAELQRVTQERDEAQIQSNQYSERVLGLDSEIVQLKHALERASTQGPSHNAMDSESVQELVKISGEVEILRRRVRETTELKALEMSNAAARIAELEEQVIQGEKQRRKLHNIIQELRGNIRVFARVRPFLPSDGIDMTNLPDSAIMPSADGVSVRAIKKPGMTDDDKFEEHQFTYDRVFGPSASQETIFHEVSEFVQSALDGYNVCLFSYGQTGSGKHWPSLS
jgi:kinesin family member C1